MSDVQQIIIISLASGTFFHRKFGVGRCQGTLVEASGSFDGAKNLLEISLPTASPS